MTRAQRLPLALAALALALLAPTLSACSPSHVGAAAVVGSDRVSTADVQTSAQAVISTQREAGTPVSESDLATLTREQVRRRVFTLILAEAGRAKGVTVSQGEIDDFLNSIVSGAGQDGLDQQMRDAGIPQRDLRGVVHDLVLQAKLVKILVPGDDADQQITQQRSQALAELVTSTAKQLGVTINPRYGSWDASKATIVEPSPLAGPDGDDSIRSQ